MEEFPPYVKNSRQPYQCTPDVPCGEMQDCGLNRTIYLSGNGRKSGQEDMLKIIQPGVNLKGGYHGIRHATGAVENVSRTAFKDTSSGLPAHEFNVSVI